MKIIAVHLPEQSRLQKQDNKYGTLWTGFIITNIHKIELWPEIKNMKGERLQKKIAK